MISLHATNLGKRYVHQWVFRNLEASWVSGQRVAITGGNGSGKSTLLQVLSGAAPATEGHLIHVLNGRQTEVDYWYRHLAMATPGLDLPDALSLRQFLNFHLRLKPLKHKLDAAELARELQLAPHLDKEIRLFSSGMRQRLKLALCLWADVPLILLDEPTSHLDAHYIGWYQEQLTTLGPEQLVFVASNDEREYPGFTDVVAAGLTS